PPVCFKVVGMIQSGLEGLVVEQLASKVPKPSHSPPVSGPRHKPVGNDVPVGVRLRECTNKLVKLGPRTRTILGVQSSLTEETPVPNEAADVSIGGNRVGLSLKDRFIRRAR